jgi:protease PrsW
MDPKSIIIAFLSGIIPSLFWLWFWLREDKENPEPKGLIFITFVVGMLAVIFVIPLEKFAQGNIIDNQALLFVALASIEEIMKYLGVSLIALKSKIIDQPIDYPIYFLTAALGFAALENTLFLVAPISRNEVFSSISTGNLRFVGATLLHVAASATIGIALGLAFFQTKFVKKIALFIGIIIAITLHSIFNFLIMGSGSTNVLVIFGFLWVVIIIIMLLFEKLRRMSGFIKN